MELPKPACTLGYTLEQVEEIVGEARIKEFERWIRGQTFAVCADHGSVIYGYDLKNFLRDGPILD